MDTIFPILFLILFIALYIKFLLYVGNKIDKNDDLSHQQKLMWKIFVFFAPLMGLFFYYLFGVKKR
jgi:hypothetical protein